MMNIYIKNMVYGRCILIVHSIKNELQKTGVEVAGIFLGEATILHADGMPNLKMQMKDFMPSGFSLIEDKKEKIVRHVKQLVEEVYAGDFDFPDHFLFSNIVTDRIMKDYDSISAIFTEVEKTAIEKYIINHRIEKVKEYLVYSDLTLSGLSFKFGFSSIAHLSRQFKTHTGLNPPHFRKVGAERNAIANAEDLN